MDCSFCGYPIEKGTETIFVTKKGKALYLCSGKCERNLLKLGRTPRKVKWTAAYIAEKDIRIKPKPSVKAREGLKETEKKAVVEEEIKGPVEGKKRKKESYKGKKTEKVSNKKK